MIVSKVSLLIQFNVLERQRRTSRTNIFKSKIIELRESGKTENYGYLFRTCISKSDIYVDK